MPTRVRLLVTIAVALLAASFHVRLKKDPDYDIVNRIAAETFRSRDWIGHYPAEIDLPTLDGGRFKLSEHVGREVVILNFFATWCGPCRKEMPELQRFVTAHAGQPVTFVAVDGHEDPNVVKKYRDDAKLTFPIVIADDELTRKFGVESYPTTVLIGPDGTILLYETSAIANTDVTLEPLVRATRTEIAQHRGIAPQEFLKRSAEDVRPGTASAKASGPHLTGRAFTIANTMDCVCGCTQTLAACTCNTATKMKAKLAKGEFGNKTDAEIKNALNAEFCMKGTM